MSFNQLWKRVLERTHIQGAGSAEVSRVLHTLGDPHQKYKIIHVAGTNGKGSVCTLLAHCLSSAGEKTGLFVSPHLNSPCERISINEQDISQEDFCPVLKQVFQAEGVALNFFEILTVAAFVYFAQKKVSYVVLETGLGGAKDPTNVCVPMASVITSIGLDHTHLLGSSLEEIAREKGGIIKPNIPVFIGDLPVEAQSVIRQLALAKNAPLYQPSFFENISCNWAQNITFLKSVNGEVWPLHILGNKQAQNANLVHALCNFLDVPVLVQKKAFETVCIKCRFEVLSQKNTHFILDGAHNPQAVESFVALWKKHPAYPHATLVFGAMRDKDYQKMLLLLTPHFSRIILTQLDLPRCVPAEELFKNCPHVRKEIIPDYRKVLVLVDSLIGASEKWVAVVGSFYLTSAVRKTIL